VRPSLIGSLHVLVIVLVATEAAGAQSPASVQSVISNARETVAALSVMASSGAHSFAVATKQSAKVAELPSCRMPVYQPPGRYQAVALPTLRPSPERSEPMPVVRPLCDAQTLTPSQLRLCASQPDASGACIVRDDVAPAPAARPFRPR
jgi:hypothetical protein